MAQSYKALKEDFVSNLSGGTVLEINSVTAVAPAAYLLWSALQSRQNFFVKYGPPAILGDFLLNIAAFLFATTLYSSNILLLNALLVLPAALLCTLPPVNSQQKKHLKPPPTSTPQEDSDGQEKLDALPVRPFITAYRGAMMVSTCVAILAVDFRVFPRRFAKVETWGTSLMDMGVGSFVFSAGLVSARPVLSARLAGKTSSLGTSLRASLRSSAPLLLLGLIRFYSVKGLDYAEHVTEYGVHWNFFFTLAFLPPFVALFQSIPKMITFTAPLSLLIGSIYQIILEITSLKAYILTAPRTDLLSQNREGIISFWGYLAIFLTGQAVGFDVLLRKPRGVPSSAPGPAQRRALLQRLIFWVVGWTVLFFAITSFKFGLNIRVSRRMANLPYIFWVSAFNCAQISIFCLIETIFFPGVYIATDVAKERQYVDRATSKILKSFNRNGLAIFLLANLLTGLVNLSLDTLSMGQTRAMGVLVAYSSLLTAAAVALDSWNLSIKL
ncbi:hypothetical protein N7G274_008030 [Stereocaulon virgatum]|uniref:GPI-anchored wall transfer protein n=1 Tax=Stereocaulon virgatum TaxID=373712 RepID=A0ABR4A4Q4_9LECA